MTTISLQSDPEQLRQLMRPLDIASHCPGGPELLKLSVRTTNALMNSGVHFVFQLIQKTEEELTLTRNFGPSNLDNAREVLDGIGLSLNTRIEPDVLERLERFVQAQIKAEFVFSDKAMPGLSSLTEAVELVAGRRQELAELLAWPGTQLILERPDWAHTVLGNLELLGFAAALQKLGKF